MLPHHHNPKTSVQLPVSVRGQLQRTWKYRCPAAYSLAHAAKPQHTLALWWEKGLARVSAARLTVALPVSEAGVDLKPLGVLSPLVAMPLVAMPFGAVGLPPDSPPPACPCCPYWVRRGTAWAWTPADMSTARWLL